MVAADTIGQTFGKLLLQKYAITVESVHRMTYLPHLVVAYHRDVGMIDGRTDIPGVVIRFVDIQVYRHGSITDSRLQRYEFSPTSQKKMTLNCLTYQR